MQVSYEISGCCYDSKQVLNCGPLRSRLSPQPLFEDWHLNFEGQYLGTQGEMGATTLLIDNVFYDVVLLLIIIITVGCTIFNAKMNYYYFFIIIILICNVIGSVNKATGQTCGGVYFKNMSAGVALACC